MFYLLALCLAINSCAKDSDLFYETALVEEEIIAEEEEENSEEQEEIVEEEEVLEEEEVVEEEEETFDNSGKFPVSGANVFYVTPEGNERNTGKTEAEGWNLTNAFKSAVAGDIIYIKAGLYSDFNIIQNNDGTQEEPIRFIGYRTTPGDIDSDAQKDYTMGTQTIKVLTAFEYGDEPNADLMPVMEEFNTTSTAILINGNYLELENIQINKYGRGLRNNGNRNVFKNIVCFDQGNQNSESSNNGHGIYNYGSNCSFKNIYVEDSGAQGFTIQGSFNTFDAITVAADNNGDPMDYYFLFQEGHDNVATNIHVKRVGNLKHYGHGITYKTSKPCYNNNVSNFIIDDTNLELQFPGVHNNEVKNGYIIKQPVTRGQLAGGIRLANGSYDNIYSNIFVENSTIYFMDWNDGLSGDVDNDSSDGNVFNQITISGGDQAVSFNYYGNGFFDSDADNNTFYNCTFYGNNHMFERSRANSNTQFVNCIFSDISNESNFTGGSPGYAIDASFVNSNFFDLGFNEPTGENITEMNPNFRSESNGDFSLLPNSPLKGKGIATPFLAAGNDLGAAQ